MEMLTPIIIQAVGGVLGALGASAAMKQAAMGIVPKVIAGLVGGVGLGQIIQMIMPDLSGALVDGGSGLVGGAVLSAIAGMVMKGKAA